MDAWPFALMGLLGTIMASTDILMLGWLRDAKDVGLYSAAIKPVQTIYAISGIVETTHVVSMSQDYYRQLCGARVTHEWVIVQAFKFLLERESNTEILPEFDLHIINRYFPEFEAEIAKRLED